MRKILNELVSSVPGVVQLKYHERKSLKIFMENSVVKSLASNTYSGVGARVLVNGVFGFACTAITSKEAISKAIKDAYNAAKTGEGLKQSFELETNPLKGEFSVKETRPLSSVPFDEKFLLVKSASEKLKKANEKISNTKVVYSEYIDEKIIVTSYGADAVLHDAKSMFYTNVVAADGNIMENGSAASGATGGWEELFRNYSPDQMIENAVKQAVNKINAEAATGGVQTVIIEPSLVGLLAHEAIGHTVEADLVDAGAVTKGKIGQKVSSELVTLVDDPLPIFDYAGAGVLLVDDEGNKPEKVEVIKDGILKSYLHDSESAKKLGVKNTGNARAFTYSDEPIIRMRNTYIEAGDKSAEEIISSTKDGIYLKGSGGGQADSNAEFMFTVSEPWKIENGKITRPLKEVTISGQAFDVLNSVDMVGNKVLLDMGYGHCGKMQAARVDGGGPVLRCKVKLGGKN